MLALNTKEELGDRYYNSVYSLLLRPETAVETKRHPMLLNLVYRTVSGDKNTSRQKSFIKRLLMVSISSKTPLQAAVLVLLGKKFAWVDPFFAIFDFSFVRPIWSYWIRTYVIPIYWFFLSFFFYNFCRFCYLFDSEKRSWISFKGVRSIWYSFLPSFTFFKLFLLQSFVFSY